MHEMLRFAQDLKTCRKIAFAKVGLLEEDFLFRNYAYQPVSTSRQAHRSLPMHGIMQTPWAARDPAQW